MPYAHTQIRTARLIRVIAITTLITPLDWFCDTFADYTHQTKPSVVLFLEIQLCLFYLTFHTCRAQHYQDERVQSL